MISLIQKYAVVLFAIISITHDCRAGVYGFLPDLGLPETDFALGNTFWRPNEENPGDAIPLFQRAHEGVYVTVGSERGFMAAALSPRVTHLLLTDYDSVVVRYNRVNTALIKAASGRSDYLRLRLNASLAHWQRVSHRAGLFAFERELLQSPEVWSWWQENVRDFGKFAYFHALPGTTDEDFAFKGANYLHDESLFTRVKALADRGRIEAIQLDFRDHTSLRRVCSGLRSIGLRLAVLDMSNAWVPTYVGIGDSFEDVQDFRPCAASGALVILVSVTDPMPAPRPDVRFPGHEINAWSYRAYTFEYLSSTHLMPQREYWPPAEGFTINGRQP